MPELITSFSDDATENIYNGVNTKKARQRLSQKLWEKATTKLDILNRAFRLEDLKIPPNNRLEKLYGDLAGIPKLAQKLADRRVQSVKNRLLQMG